MIAQIRPAADADAMLIARLSRQTFVDAFGAFNTADDMALFLNTQFSIDSIVSETRQPQFQFYLAWLNNKAVGYLKLIPHLSGHPEIALSKPALEISRIYIEQSAIGNGLGQQLMDFSIEKARTGNFATICLGVWEKNEKAIRFYQRNGFIQVGTHSFLLGTDRQTDWLMARKV
jgi:diamine N-acetyltransferase